MGECQAQRTRQLALLLIPDHNMPVIAISAIKIDLTGAMGRDLSVACCSQTTDSRRNQSE